MPITGKHLSLYFHVPFCKKKCPYCHFYSVYHTVEKEMAYLKAIKNHLAQYKSFFKKHHIVSIYFGGGTPSHLKVETIEEILNELEYTSDIEITLEANPEDFVNNKDKIKGFKKIGINRISLGIQSFNDKTLKILDRKHSALDARKAIFNVFNSDIKNISIDLMYDVMKQDVFSWNKTLNEIESLPITHISLYNLTFEEKTLFYKNRKKLIKDLPNDEISLSFLNSASLQFEKLGFYRYEISGFAKSGYESFHNLGYWQARDFLGFGPSAFSYLNKIRFQNICNLKKYCKALENNTSPIGFEEKLKYPKNVLELLAINLRLKEGIDILEFEKKHGKIPLKTLNLLKKSDFINFKNLKISLNEKGFLFYDSLAEMII